MVVMEVIVRHHFRIEAHCASITCITGIMPTGGIVI
jgi:hypothetical protein